MSDIGRFVWQDVMRTRASRKVRKAIAKVITYRRDADNLFFISASFSFDFFIPMDMLALV